jgi:hypothetical protein
MISSALAVLFGLASLALAGAAGEGARIGAPRRTRATTIAMAAVTGLAALLFATATRSQIMVDVIGGQGCITQAPIEYQFDATPHVIVDCDLILSDGMEER